MKLHAAVLVLALATVGCAHSGGQQMTPTTHTLTMTVTSSNPTASKWFALKETLAAGATKCDDPTSTSYKPVNAVGQSSSTFVDATSAGTTVCEFMQYQDAATPPATSVASNVVGPYAIPANPTAPVIAGQSAKNDVPAVANPCVLSYVTNDGSVSKINVCTGEMAGITAGGAPPQIHAVVR